MTDLAKYLGLLDPDRDTLQPDPTKDVDLYVDMDSIVPKTLARLARKAPKLVLYGDFGTGKTHLIHVLISKLDLERFKPVYVKLEAYGKNTDIHHVHNNLMVRLDVEGVLQAAYPFATPSGEPDADKAFQLLHQNPSDPDARAWLFATGPTPSRALKAGFTSRLRDMTGGVRYITIWRAIARSYHKATGRELIIFFDESEVFQEVIKDRGTQIGVAVRELFDAGQKDFGVVMGLTISKARGGTNTSHPLLRPDVATRIQDIQIELPNIANIIARRQFIETLLSKLMKRQTLLDNQALSWFVENLSRLSVQKFSILRDPAQREAIKLLDNLAQDSLYSQADLPLIQSDLEGWA